MTIRRAAVSAGRWTATSAVTRALVQVLQTAVLARLLLPSDFGLMAIVASILAVVSLVSEFGLSRALIHYDDVPESVLSSLFWIAIAMSLLLSGVLIGIAPLLADVYGSPTLTRLLQISSLVFPLSAFGQQHRAMSEKRLDFSSLAYIEIASVLIAFAVATCAALAGCGVYSLVYGLLFGTGFNSLLAWHFLSRGRRFALHVNLAEAITYIRFGGYLVGDNVAATLSRQTDVFVAGLFATPAQLGFFATSRDLSLRIASVFNPIMTRVGFPLMARTRHDKDKLKSIYLKMLGITASLNFPTYLGLAVFAQDIVLVLYGDRWAEATPYVQALAIWGLIRSTGNPVSSLLFAEGRARLSFWWNILQLVVTPIALLPAASWGLSALLTTMIGFQLALFWPLWRWLVHPVCGATFREYLSALAKPLSLSIASLGLSHLIVREIAHPVLHLIAGGTIAVAVYCLVNLRFNPTLTGLMKDGLSPLVRGKSE